MDLLGSILGNMTGPPKVSQQEQERRKKEREMTQKFEEKQREMSKLFRQKVEKKISDFVSNKSLEKVQLPPMSMVERQVVKDVADVAGLVPHSFGVDGVDRHIILWKKEFSPCEEELSCIRQGKVWDPIQAAKEKEAKLQQQIEDEQEYKKKKKEKFVPKTNYREKYQHILGNESELSAVRKTEVNKSFGMVSAESKKDKRTMEEIQADIRAKKRQRQSDDQN